MAAPPECLVCSYYFSAVVVPYHVLTQTPDGAWSTMHCSWKRGACCTYAEQSETVASNFSHLRDLLPHIYPHSPLCVDSTWQPRLPAVGVFEESHQTSPAKQLGERIRTGRSMRMSVLFAYRRALPRYRQQLAPMHAALKKLGNMRPDLPWLLELAELSGHPKTPLAVE